MSTKGAWNCEASIAKTEKLSIFFSLHIDNTSIWERYACRSLMNPFDMILQCRSTCERLMTDVTLHNIDHHGTTEERKYFFCLIQ